MERAAALIVPRPSGPSDPTSAPHRRHDLPEDLRDSAPDLRIVVRAGGDHDREVKLGHDEEPLTAVAEARAPHECLPLPNDVARPP